VWASHADEVTELPEGFERTATSDVCGIEAMSDTDRDLYGVQWHPEVAHTEQGEVVFENFKTICTTPTATTGWTALSPGDDSPDVAVLAVRIGRVRPSSDECEVFFLLYSPSQYDDGDAE